MQSFLSKLVRSKANNYLRNPNKSHEKLVSHFHSSSSSTKFDIKSYISENRMALRNAMEEAIPIKEPTNLCKSMRYNILNGRMIAPLMCIAACELVGGNQAKIILAACSIQMAMYMAVIHDDLPCIDNDDIRSGKPTNHKVFGEPVALLAGDALGVFAFQHIVDATKDVAPDRVLRAVSELGKAVGPDGMQAGQVVDVLSGHGSRSLEQLEFINLHKCGVMFSGCMVVGGIIGGGTYKEIEMLRIFGRKVGLMIQLVDDLSDIEEDSMKKQVTYPQLIGIEKTKEMAAKLKKDAHDSLAGFDQDKVAPLIALMDHRLSDVLLVGDQKEK